MDKIEDLDRVGTSSMEEPKEYIEMSIELDIQGD